MRSLVAALGLGRVGAEDVDVELGERPPELRDSRALGGLGSRHAEDAGLVAVEAEARRRDSDLLSGRPCRG